MMKRIAYLLLAGIALVLFSQSGLAATIEGDTTSVPAGQGPVTVPEEQEAQPPPTLDYEPFTGSGMPLITDGLPLNPAITIDSKPAPTETLNTTTASAAQPVISVWYGSNQNFGQKGIPQKWVNILGNVSSPEGVNITSLTYSLNGSAERPLTIGPTGYRLEDPGDFNIELDVNTLNNGNNSVVIRARDANGMETTETVTVNFATGNTWPQSDVINWGSGQIQDQAWIVDGQWKKDSGGTVRSFVPGYDRLIVLGDRNTWTEYEVTVPVTVYEVFPTTGPSNGAGIGLIMHWQGHDNESGEQPNRNWRNLGALGWYNWSTTGFEALEMRVFGGDRANRNLARQLELNTTYIFKMSVQAVEGQPFYYRFKMWKADQEEPIEWDLGAYGKSGEPASGSLGLLAHQVDAALGKVTVQPLSEVTPQLTTGANGPGTVYASPPGDNATVHTYAYGEKLTLYPTPDYGYVFDSWSGDVTGKANPLSFRIYQDMEVTAKFVPHPPTKLTVNVEGNGRVQVNPDKAQYNFAEDVQLTAIPDPGYAFVGWSGDASGIAETVTVKMEGDKQVTATFIDRSAVSPRSDDFSGCTLDTSLWAFENPVGDATMSLTGKVLQISIPAGSSHNMWQRPENLAPRVMQDTVDQDFEIQVKFDSLVEQRYQMEGILIEQDADNWLRFDFYHDGGNAKVSIARTKDNAASLQFVQNVDISGASSLYMRVRREGDVWTQWYSLDGTNWVKTLPQGFSYAMEVNRTGVFVGNHIASQGGTAPAFTGLVDYFFNTAAPIEPEDGPLSVKVSTDGAGQVNVQPPGNGGYACNQEVTLQAVPDAGWKFVRWTGDLTSTENPAKIMVKRSLIITAVFEKGANQVFLPAVLGD